MSKSSESIEKLKEINKELIKLEGLEGIIDEYGVYISGQKVENEIKIGPGENDGSISGEAYIENEEYDCNEVSSATISYSCTINPFDPLAQYSTSSSRKLRSELLTSKNS